MKQLVRSIRRAILPISVFIATAALHYVWLGLFPETDPIQDQWVAVETDSQTPWLGHYIETRSYYLGFSYALALAFATEVLRRYRERRLGTTRILAIGGMSYSGLLAVAGCYLLGCCGSPMLAVYLSFFGAAFLPVAKPFVALFTALLIGLSWWRMNRVQCMPRSATKNQST